MPKRGAKHSSTFTATVALVVAALVLFLGGEALITTRTDAGRIAAKRWLHVGDDAKVSEIVARQIRRGLDGAGVPQDSVRERALTPGASRAPWAVGCAHACPRCK